MCVRGSYSVSSFLACFLRHLSHHPCCGLLSALAGVSAGALEGTSKNFDAEVINSGKNAFVKFLAPW